MAKQPSRPFHQRRRKGAHHEVLMVLTSHDELGNTGRKTGFWLEELAAPYYVFKDAGAEIVLASPKGRSAAARSEEQRAELPDRIHPPVRSGRGRQRTARLRRAPRQRQAGRLRYRLLPRWPRADVGSRRRRDSIKLLQSFFAAGKTFAVVCHSPGALRHVKTRWQAARRGQDRDRLHQSARKTRWN